MAYFSNNAVGVLNYSSAEVILKNSSIALIIWIL